MMQIFLLFCLLAVSSLRSVVSFTTTRSSARYIQTSILRTSTITSSHLSRVGAKTRGSSLSMGPPFGDVYYRGFEKWCSAYAEQTRIDFPDVFRLPEGVYEVEIARPLGIVFEEVAADEPRGVKVCELVPGGNAEACGLVGVGDLLIAATGTRQIGAKFERQLIQTDVLDYDTIISCIGSNIEKYGCSGPILQFLKAGSPMPTSYLSGKLRSTASPLQANS
mmetsp:Transcript_12588/g.27950  ORF Transcript_12588/g.27950 Transcript_12588/m.27950 type:complete len:221 (+) Transcript_12588:129-791(+)